MAIRVVIIYQRLAALLGVEYGRGVHAFDHILGGIYCCFVKYGVTLTRCYNDVYQRWANSVLMTEYEYEYYSTFQKWPNTNTNIIRFEKGDRIRIRILFGLKKATEYEYEYYSVWKNLPNTNTNIICFEKITRIRMRILVLGLNYSNNIQIPNYSLTSGWHWFHSH